MKQTLDGIPIINYEADWSFWSKIAVVSAHEAILLTLNIDPRGYRRFPKSELAERYKEIDKIAASHIACGSLRFLNPTKGTFRTADWWAWAESTGIEIPSPSKNATVAQAEENNQNQCISGVISTKTPKESGLAREEKQDIEYKIANDLYVRMSNDPDVSEVGGGTMIFDYLKRVGTLRLEGGVEYFLHVKKSSRDNRKDVGKRKYAGVTISYTANGKLQNFGIRKLVSAFESRKKQEISQ